MRKLLTRRLVALSAPALLMGCETNRAAPDAAQQVPPAPRSATNWPADQASMQPGQSRSSNIVSLPADLPITPAGPDAPPVLRNALGQWRGYGGWNGEFSVAVAIQSVTSEGARGMFDGASSANHATRLGWAFVLTDSDELKGALSNNFAVLTMRQRPDRHMDFLFEAPRRRFSGVLSRLA